MKNLALVALFCLSLPILGHAEPIAKISYDAYRGKLFIEVAAENRGVGTKHGTLEADKLVTVCEKALVDIRNSLRNPWKSHEVRTGCSTEDTFQVGANWVGRAKAEILIFDPEERVALKEKMLVPCIERWTGYFRDQESVDAAIAEFCRGEKPKQN